MIVRVGRLGAVAVAAQVSGHHGEVACQARRDQVPHDVSLRVTVQEEERRAVAAESQVDLCLACVDGALLEPLEHRSLLILRVLTGTMVVCFSSPAHGPA